MAYIGKTPTVGNFQVCDAISVVNGQAAYTLQVGGANVAPESANHMLVSLNGILQKPGSSFTISGSTMTFASNLATGDVIDFVQILGNVLDLGQPSDDTVKTASIQANAVTAAKLNNDIVSGLTALGATPADTDEFLVSDAGTIKRVDYSHIKGGGKVLQVVENSSTTTVATSSTSLQSILTASITPSSSSNKVLVTAGIARTSASASSNAKAYSVLYRGDTSGTSISDQVTGPSTDHTFQLFIRHLVLDSPSTTSSQTYTLTFAKGSSNTSSVTTDGQIYNIILMEIEA